MAYFGLVLAVVFVASCTSGAGHADGGGSGSTGTGGAGGGGGSDSAGGAGGKAGAGGSAACANNTDPVQSSCANGVLTSIDHCAVTHTVCAYGCHDTQTMFTAACNDPPDAGLDGVTGGTGGQDRGKGGDGGSAGGGGGTAGTAAPDGGADAPLGTFVMCDDHADFNGRGRCAATGKVGAVFAQQDRGAASTVTTLTAAFGATNPPSEVGCTREAVGGACTALTCPRASAARVTGPAAGVITAKSNGGMILTAPDATTGAYDVGQLGRALWSMPKAALAFSAAGGAISTFGETFCGPVAATITKPASAPSAALTIDRAVDLPVQWTGSVVGDLEFVFRDDTTSASTAVEVQCFFTTASGQGAVPKAALAKIGTGAHTVASYLWVRKIGLGSGTCVELTGIQTNDSSVAGVPFNGTATFQ